METETDAPLWPKIVTECWVPGAPKTKGHLEVLNKQTGNVRETKDSVRWRMFVVERVKADRMRRELTSPSRGPIAVRAIFWQNVPDVTVKSAGSGDVDTLARNVLDALSLNLRKALKGAGAYVDDMQVTSLHVDKLACDQFDLPEFVPGPGLLLRVWEESPQDLALTRARARSLYLMINNIGG